MTELGNVHESKGFSTFHDIDLAQRTVDAYAVLKTVTLDTWTDALNKSLQVYAELHQARKLGDLAIMHFPDGEYIPIDIRAEPEPDLGNELVCRITNLNVTQRTVEAYDLLSLLTEYDQSEQFNHALPTYTGIKMNQYRGGTLLVPSGDGKFLPYYYW